MSNPIIEIIELSYGWSVGNPIAPAFSINLSNGIHCIVGSNGVGKSTLLRTIAGIIAPISGEVKRYGNVGYLGHNIGIYNQLTLRENLKVWSGILDGDDISKMDWLIDKLEARDILDKLPTKFSKGQFQKAGIIRSFIGSPKIIILDEPTSGLDPKSKESVQEILLNYGKEHCIIVSSHDINEVSRIATNIIKLDKNAPANILKSSQIYGTSQSKTHKVGILVEKGDIEKAKKLLGDREIEISTTGWLYATVNEGEVLGDVLKQILVSDITLLSVDDSSFIRSLYNDDENA